MQTVQHPLSKTSTELRRSIYRLELFLQQNPSDAYAPRVAEMIDDLKAARNKIPEALKDLDVQGK